MKNYLENALAQYNLQNRTATLLGHNENMAFNVADLFLLRIHKSADVFSSDFLYNGLCRKDIYNTEMQFLLHLINCGLNVQSPVANNSGEYVSEIEDKTFATVLNWISGHNATEKDISADFCREFGSVVAHLHSVSKNFKAENILKYNGKLCDTLIGLLDDSNDKGYFKPKHYKTLTEICSVIKTAFNDRKNEFTIVHGDLSLSNILITPLGLSLIDFSLFGYGHPMIDIACAYSFITDKDMRNAFDEGYKTSGGIIDCRMVNICYAFNEVMGILLHIDKLATETWFENWLSGLCTNVFVPVISGKELLWTQLNG